MTIENTKTGNTSYWFLCQFLDIRLTLNFDFTFVNKKATDKYKHLVACRYDDVYANLLRLKDGPRHGEIYYMHGSIMHRLYWAGETITTKKNHRDDMISIQIKATNGKFRTIFLSSTPLKGEE